MLFKLFFQKKFKIPPLTFTETIKHFKTPHLWVPSVFTIKAVFANSSIQNKTNIWHFTIVKDAVLQTLQPLFNKLLDYSPSVFSGTVLCFTKATSPAPSAKHLVNINPSTKMHYETAPMHWTLPADSQRPVCYILSATDLFPCAESSAQGRY